MTKLFLDRAILRGQKSAQIDVSSAAGIASWPGRELYAGSKFFNQRWNENLRIGLSNKVDFLVHRPAYMKTNLTGNRKISWNTCLPEESVEYALRALGNVGVTYGHPKHALFGNIISFLMYFFPFEAVSGLIRLVHDMVKSKA